MPKTVLRVMRSRRRNHRDENVTCGDATDRTGGESAALSPLVSVCIPAYNAGAFLAETVSSVIDQTMDDLEVIVVDNASTDGGIELLDGLRSDPRLSVHVNERNLGAAANWNRAISMASGRYVKLLCADDALVPTCLEAQVRAFESSGEDVVLVAGKRNIVDASGRVILRGRGLSGMSGCIDGRDAIRRTVRSGTNPFGEPVCVLMRRQAVERCGEFSHDAAYMIDLEYWCRLAAMGAIFALPEVVGVFRVSESGWSNEIGRAQARQTIALLERLRARHPDLITARDLLEGRARARMMNVGRLAIYTLVEARNRLTGSAC